MDHDLEKYRQLRDYFAMSESEIRKLIRMVDSLLGYVDDPDAVRLNPELCHNVQDMGGRIRALLSSRLVALEDLILILKEHGIAI